MANELLTLLIVDDDEAHRELIRLNLRRAGVTNSMLMFENGQAALDYLLGPKGKDAGQLLVLLDIRMPGIDGVEVLRRIKADPELRTIPVIMLTTTDDPREIEHCYELGCNVYVTKPVSVERFIEALRRLGLFISVVSLPAAGPLEVGA